MAEKTEYDTLRFQSMDESSVSPHVLVFPFPIQGNVNSMLKLAELLCLAGVKVTFLNCLYAHRRLLSHSDFQVRFSRYPGFRVETIPDGLPMEHPCTAEQFADMIHAAETTTKPLFREMMISWCRSTSHTRPPLTCIISDELLSFSIDVANEVGIPIISFCAVRIFPCGREYFLLSHFVSHSSFPPSLASCFPPPFGSLFSSRFFGRLFFRASI